MFDFLKLIYSTQMAIKLRIGVGKEPENCDRFITKPEFSKFIRLFGQKIMALRINCYAVNFEKFYNDNAATLDNLLYLSIKNVDDKV